MSIDLNTPTSNHAGDDPQHSDTSFASRLRASHTRAKDPWQNDPWGPTLDTIIGRVGSDGVERISTELVYEWLGIAPFARSGEMGERIRGLMVRRGWVPVRCRHATSKGHATRVRGYARLDGERAPSGQEVVA